MTTTYISTAELADRLIRYPEELPVPISQTLQHNLRRALAVSGIAITFFALSPGLLKTLAWSAFFVPWGLVDWPAHIAVFIADVAEALRPIVLALNITGLTIFGLLFWRSEGFSKPVEEVFHWLAGSAVVVAALSMLAFTLITVGFLTTMAFALGLWILIFVIATLFCLAVLFGVLGGR